VRKEKYCVELIFVSKAISTYLECRFEMVLFKDSSELKQVVPRIFENRLWYFVFY
jgi:hypothetical protein